MSYCKKLITALILFSTLYSATEELEPQLEISELVELEDAIRCSYEPPQCYTQAVHEQAERRRYSFDCFLRSADPFNNLIIYDSLSAKHLRSCISSVLGNAPIFQRFLEEAQVQTTQTTIAEYLLSKQQEGGLNSFMYHRETNAQLKKLAELIKEPGSIPDMKTQLLELIMDKYERGRNSWLVGGHHAQAKDLPEECINWLRAPMTLVNIVKALNVK